MLKLQAVSSFIVKMVLTYLCETFLGLDNIAKKRVKRKRTIFFMGRTVDLHEKNPKLGVGNDYGGGDTVGCFIGGSG